MDLSALSQYIKTKKDANDFITFLEELSAGVFKERASLQDELAKKAPYELISIIEKLQQSQNINTSDKNAQQNFFTDLKTLISSLPVVHLILARQPNSQTVQTIRRWFFINYKKLVLLDITTDETLIAGSVISFNGKANDYSLRSQLEGIV